MNRIPVEDVKLEVVPTDQRQSHSNQKGKLFEDLVARLLEALGFEKPTESSLRTTSNGIELDVAVKRKLVEVIGLVECKAYSSPVAAKELQAFHGKLQTERYDREDCEGFFFALPRLTASGREQAKRIQDHDTRFRYLDTGDISELLRQQGLLDHWPDDQELVSDFMILVTEHGLFQACLELDPLTRNATSMLVWGRQPVPDPVRTALERSRLSARLPVRERGVPVGQGPPPELPIVVEVAHGDDEFESHLPANPQFFVGRQSSLMQVETLITGSRPRSFVLNAKSGTGKSSFALKLAQDVRSGGGVALVFDARTATDTGYVAAALRKFCIRAETDGVLALPKDYAFGGLGSSLATISRSTWQRDEVPLVVIFDQFENVFRSEDVTRSFRDLVIAINDLDKPLKVGFSWKTDLVGWTEAHPFQLREDIRSVARVVKLEPFEAEDVDVVLDRLGRSIGTRLSEPVRHRLRQESGGLPWLLKKLSSHVRSQLLSGRDQDSLLADGLGIRSLFEEDLQQLSPSELEALKAIARIAPLAYSDAEDTTSSAVLQLLIDRRLLVLIGDKIDVSSDSFRGYLTTGGLEVKDGLLLRLRPGPTARLLLRRLALSDTPCDVEHLADEFNVTHRTLHNVSRELQYLGLLRFYEGKVEIDPSVKSSSDAEGTLRRLVREALRRHRAYDTLRAAFSENGSVITTKYFAERLADDFGSVRASQSSWAAYARAFAQWFDYAGLVSAGPAHLADRPPDLPISLLSGTVRPAGKGKNTGVYPRASAPACREVVALLASGQAPDTSRIVVNRALRTLSDLGIVDRFEGEVKLATGQQAVRSTGEFEPSELRRILEEGYPGVDHVFRMLEVTPSLGAEAVGAALRAKQAARWPKSTTIDVGKFLRSFARDVGIKTTRRAE